MKKEKYKVAETKLKKSKNKFVIITVFSIIIITIVIYYNKKLLLEKADKLIVQNSCADAFEIYKDLGNEEKYKENIDNCYYTVAKKYYDNQDYEKSYPLFLSLVDYKDSYDLYLSSYYNLALKYEEEEKYYDASKIFYEILDYNDSENKYYEINDKAISTAKVGDTIFFGNYEQDGDLKNGTEPLEWYVLSSNYNYVLVLSKYILEKREFGSSYYWGNSTIREWLNSDFYNETFSSNEKNKIQKMITSTKTEDNIFCLSAEEVRGFFVTDTSRVAYPTQRLLDDGFKTDKDAGKWWTRSISTAADGKGVVPVEADGNVRSAGTVPYNDGSYTNIGVRPALVISKNTISSDSQNMSLFGYDSAINDLDNEPYIPPVNKNNSNTRKCNGGVGCREGWHQCNPHSETGYCRSCCIDN